MNPTQVSADFYSAGQISLQDVQSIAAQGFKTIINCRPDGEDGPAQPTAAQIREAAEKCGLHYYHFPVAMGTSGAEYVAAMAAALASAPKPVLGFCRSGTRAGNLYKAAA